MLGISFNSFTFTFMHFADAFIQSDSGYTFLLSVSVFPGNWTHNLCAANAMLYHWATGTFKDCRHTEHMVIVTHLDSAIIKQRITLIAWWRCVIMNSVLSSSVRRQGKEQGDSMQSSLNSQRPTQHFYLQTHPSSGWIIHTCSPFTARWRKIAFIFISLFSPFLAHTVMCFPIKLRAVQH